MVWDVVIPISVDAEFPSVLIGSLRSFGQQREVVVLGLVHY